MSNKQKLSRDGSYLLVNSIFKTIQTEGFNSGSPAIFMRLSGCNLACKFCDTDFEDYSIMKIKEIREKILNLALNDDGIRSVNLVVITGGEPFRQMIGQICYELLKLDFKVQIETNGTIYCDIPEKVEIICSPKARSGKYFPINKALLPRVNAFKFLISTKFPGYNNIVDLGQNEYNIPVYLQPMDEYDEEINRDNKKLTVELVIKYGYRLSYQIHKELGIR